MDYTEFLQALSMTNGWLVAINIFLSLLFGALAGYLTARNEHLKDIAHDIREKRKQSYPQLWEFTGRLPLFPDPDREGIQKFGQLYNLSKDMMQWYFNSEGGMIMSDPTKVAYLKAQEQIKSERKNAYKIIEKKNPNEDETALRRILDETDFRQMDNAERMMKDIRKAFSKLRSRMTDDLMSRRRLFSIGQGWRGWFSKSTER